MTQPVSAVSPGQAQVPQMNITPPTAQMPAETDVAELAALVGSRLCHDLVSPLGAIGNGLELLQMTPALENSPEMELISQSVAAARGRITLFRMGFGAAPDGQRVSASELGELISEIQSGGRLRIDLQNDEDLPRRHVKLILLALMCMESALPWGGRVYVCRSGPGWRVVAEADRVKISDGLWAWLGASDQRAVAPAPSEVHFALLAQNARDFGRVLSSEIDAKGAEIRF